MLHRNDVIYHIASAMSAPMVSVRAYTPITEEDIEKAYSQAKDYRYIVISDSASCALNEKNKELVSRLKADGKPVLDFEEHGMAAEAERLCREKLQR